MKKRLQGLIAGVVIGAMLTSGAAIAANKTTLYDVIIDGIKIVLDGKEFTCVDANGEVVQPMIYNGTTYIPVRAVSSAFGKAVYWDGEEKTVYLGDMNGELEHPTLNLEDIENIAERNVFLDKEKNIFDNYGNFYDSYVCYENGLGSQYGNICCETLLNKKYSTFKATLFIPEGSNWDGESNIRIIGDGKLILEEVMNKTSEPIDIEVSVTEVNDFKIIFGGETEIYIANGGFYQ